MENKCFICKTPLHEIGDNRYGCDTCKRIWKENKIDGTWESEVRQVKIVKEPKKGDTYDDIVKPVKPKQP